jgi:peptidylprolyl isomerase
LIEGIQIIKRGISTDIFKFIPSLKTIVFLEKYTNSVSTDEKPSDAENTDASVDNDTGNEDADTDKKENTEIDDKSTEVSTKSKKGKS